MKHLLCSSLLAVILSLVCLPLHAAADRGGDALDFTSSRVEDHGDGWDWDSANRTLTLSGIDIEATSAASRDGVYAVKLPGDTTIVLAEGSVNSIRLAVTDSGIYSSYAIYSLGALSIKGTGSLFASVTGLSGSSSFGIYAAGNINISDGATITTSGGEVESSMDGCTAGIGTAKSFSICSSSLTSCGACAAYPSISCGTFVGGQASFVGSSVSSKGFTGSESYGIRAGGSVVISGGRLSSAASESEFISAGIRSDGSLTDISDGALITASGSFSNFSAGIMADTGLVHISGDDTSVSMHGGGDYYLKSSLSSAARSGMASGLCAGSISITGGAVFAGSNSSFASDTSADGAISSDGRISITGGSIISVANGNNGVFSISGLYNGYRPENVTISGGSFSASVADYAAKTLNFEVDRGDGWFSYFPTAEDALEYAGDANGVKITGVGSSAGLRSCAVRVYVNGMQPVFTRVLPEGFNFTLPQVPSKSGHIFMGWESSGRTYSACESVIIASDEAFVPVWAAIPDVSAPTDEENASEAEFADVSPSAWYFDAVSYVSSHSLMNGVSTGQFAPDTELSRAMIWTVLARASGVETEGGIWYAKAREWAMANGISDGEAPGDSVTREQLVTMLYRLAGGPEVDDGGIASEVEGVSVWAHDAMIWALSEGIIEGDENGETYPSATATRAQAAEILMRWANI